MINGKSVLAIIPARGGSKGIPRKNVRDLYNKPLIAWTIEEAKKSKYIDRLIVSTDDYEIKKVSEKYDCEVPFMRPTELAQDDTPGIEPVIHAISQLPEYDLIVLLQPTSPLRLVDDIDGVIEQSANNHFIPCVSIAEVEKTPYWMYRLDKNYTMIPVLGDANYTRRQDVPKIYELNGAVYVALKETIITERSFITSNTVGYIMPKERSIDIDTELDFNIAELILINR